MKCPKCKSDNTYVDKKGFSGKQAVVGAVLAGPLGAAAGTINSNKIKITCLDCGHSYSAGNYMKEVERMEVKQQKFSSSIFAFTLLLLALPALLIWWIFDSVFFGVVSITFTCVSLICLMISSLQENPKAKKDRERARKEAYYNEIFSQVNEDDQVKRSVKK